MDFLPKWSLSQTRAVPLGRFPLGLFACFPAFPRHFDGLDVLHRFFDLGGVIPFGFVIEAIVEFGLGLGLFGFEDGAAIFKRADGNLVRSDPFRRIDDGELVARGEGTENRVVRHLVDDVEGIEGLGSDLPDGFPGR